MSLLPLGKRRSIELRWAHINHQTDEVADRGPLKRREWQHSEEIAPSL